MSALASTTEIPWRLAIASAIWSKVSPRSEEISSRNAGLIEVRVNGSP